MFPVRFCCCFLSDKDEFDKKSCYVNAIMSVLHLLWLVIIWQVKVVSPSELWYHRRFKVSYQSRRPKFMFSFVYEFNTNYTTWNGSLANTIYCILLYSTVDYRLVVGLIFLLRKYQSLSPCTQPIFRNWAVRASVKQPCFNLCPPTASLNLAHWPVTTSTPESIQERC